jgi:hypothetical protein
VSALDVGAVKAPTIRGDLESIKDIVRGYINFPPPFPSLLVHKALSQLFQTMFWQKDQMERLLPAFHALNSFHALN